ncbi:MAG: lipoprotein-releasing ABC transporter permease subunit [Gammaproteobacteria bacterium]|jgi:lipoprotein-releasing system permease protein|nr:lipoprotein-releasing ABC transporter permease subunit [Gammaproteobacteria bacterium]MDH3985946.1 lipoprotein-releasing ABC transporter permease subunit [Gammaproteobacteria bacterium]
MFRPFELFVGLRYTHSRRRTHFISFISMTSMLGIALGVTALITVLSVMNGFEKELRDRILGMASHATVTTYTGRLPDWQGMQQALADNERIVAMAPYVRGESMLSLGKQVSGALLRGVLPGMEGDVSDVVSHINGGDLGLLEEGKYSIILGSELAIALGAGIGDSITVVSPQVTIGPTGIMPRLRRFTVTGIFEVGMYEYDRGVALVHIKDAAKLFRLDDNVTGLRLKLDDIFAAPKIARALSAELPLDYRVEDWTRQHANFFRAVKTEKRVMFIILTLIVAVAAFNIVSTLVMVVTDKRADIAILRTLGASPGSIMTVFIIQGIVIGAMGTALGVAGGVGLALNVETIVPAIESMFNVEFLAADVYYISDVPSELHWNDVWVMASVSLGLSLLATLYPAWRAASTQPAEALRYE